jgi:Fe-coproporphyrin III synthase
MKARRGGSYRRLIGREAALMRQRSLDMMIFFVTGRCNARCRHCFYWQNLGIDHKGLSLEQIGLMTQSMPRFRTLLLSGGEPSLRDDLPDVVSHFLLHNHIEHLGVPTNGLLPNRIAALADRISDLDERLLVTFSVSIDGYAETHDAMRGVPGAYQAAMRTLSLLREVAASHANFRTHVNTVISAANLTEVKLFAEHLTSTQLVDGHFFELIRGDPPDVMLKMLPPAELGNLYVQLLSIQERYIKQESVRRRGRYGGGLRYVMDVGNLVNRYRHQLFAYSRQRRWNFPCLAGESIGVIDYDGGLRACELRERSVSLTEHNLDFDQAWNVDILRQEAQVARSHICDCTHTCFIGASMRHSFRARLFEAPWSFARYRLGHPW